MIIDFKVLFYKDCPMKYRKLKYIFINIQKGELKNGEKTKRYTFLYQYH